MHLWIVENTDECMFHAITHINVWICLLWMKEYSVPCHFSINLLLCFDVWSLLFFFLTGKPLIRVSSLHGQFPGWLRSFTLVSRLCISQLYLLRCLLTGWRCWILLWVEIIISYWMSVVEQVPRHSSPRVSWDPELFPSDNSSEDYHVDGDKLPIIKVLQLSNKHKNWDVAVDGIAVES